jgi:hypothetical protein
MPKYIFQGPGVLRLSEDDPKEHVAGDEVELTEVQVLRLRNASLYFDDVAKGKQAGANGDKAAAPAENTA